MTGGKEAEGSDRSGSMIGFWAQDWDKNRCWLPNELALGYTFQDKMEIHQMRTRASPKREVISCLEEECVASTCSKLLERASLDGFRAGKRERPGPRGNPCVV